MACHYTSIRAKTDFVRAHSDRALSAGCFISTFASHVKGAYFKAISFSKNSHFPARMISDSLEVEIQKENESTKGAHARFEPGALTTK